MDSESEIAAIDDRLETQYALRKRHPEREEIYRDHQRRSAAMRAAGDCRLDVRYGDGPRCLLDVFPAGERAPALFFIHGGYWRALDKSYVSFVAEPYRDAGMTVVMPSYDLVPAVRVGGIVDQIRAAFAWTVAHLAPARVVVAGHSAGGQLAAMLALDQAARGGGPIVGLAGISGAFDLRPLLRTSINRDLMLSAPGWAVHNHASDDGDYVHELTVQDQPLHIAMESLLWQESLKLPMAVLGQQEGFGTNKAMAG